jgi:zinc transport system permease protein
MLVVPVAGAAQVARGFREALLASVILAELAVLVGITLSFHYQTTAGGTIVLVAVALYIAAVLVGKAQASRKTADEQQPVGDTQSIGQEQSVGDEQSVD